MGKVAIVGMGYVGKAYLKVFPDAIQYDEPLKIGTREEVNSCELAIIAVPTPMQDSADEFKKVDLSVIESVIAWIETPLILIKSTIPPGTTDRLVGTYGKRIAFSPEYVGESKYQITPWKYMSSDDPRTHEFQIFGGAKDTRDAIADIFVRALGPEKMYYLIEAVEAEIVKYMENAWGATKVTFFQEFYDLCQKFGASYHRVREGWALDSRVERMHSAVFVDSRGFSGKCLPKDLNGIIAAGNEVGADLSLLKTVLKKNSNYNK